MWFRNKTEVCYECRHVVDKDSMQRVEYEAAYEKPVMRYYCPEHRQKATKIVTKMTTQDFIQEAYVGFNGPVNRCIQSSWKQIVLYLIPSNSEFPGFKVIDDPRPAICEANEKLREEFECSQLKAKKSGTKTKS